MARLPVLVAGDTVADVYPGDSLALGEGALSLYPGGTGANVAVGLARLYGAPRLHTALASDRFADLLAANFRAEGIDDDLFRRVDGNTSLAVLERGEPIDWAIYHQPATLALDADAVPETALNAVDRVHLTGIALASEAGRAATVDLARRGAARGCTVSFDLNARANMWADPADCREAVAAVLAHAGVAFASVDDLATVTNDDEPGPDAGIEWLHDHGAGTAILTLGADGAVASDGDRTVRDAGFDVDAVNPAGAGDAFAAGVVGAFDAGSLPELLTIGNAAGALAATADSPTAPLARGRVRDLLSDRAPQDDAAEGETPEADTPRDDPLAAFERASEGPTDG